MRNFLFLSFLINLVFAAAPAHAGKVSYQSNPTESCYGFPAITSIHYKDRCVGLVDRFDNALPSMPRKLLFDDKYLYVTDMGGWDVGNPVGRIWRLQLTDGKIERTLLIDKLDRVHGIRKGADGFIYIAEATRISRFHPMHPQGLYPVIGNLPDSYTAANQPVKQSSHPLKEFIFLNNQDIVVNIGAPSNDCTEEYGVGKACLQRDQQAELRVYAYDSQSGQYDPNFKVLARGLRNSMGLYFNANTNEVYQAENSADAVGTPDELNVIRLDLWNQGKVYDFGWPFCHSSGERLNSYGIFRTFCGSKADQPYILLPAHVSPLDIARYDGEMFPELKGSLLISWHGWRPSGSRIAAYKTDTWGRMLQTAPQLLIENWEADPLNRHPKGRPVGMAIDEAGAVFVVDDVNHAVLVIAKLEKPYADTTTRVPEATAISLTAGQLQYWDSLYSSTLTSLRCNTCHGDVLSTDPRQSLQSLFKMGWIKKGVAAADQILWLRMTGDKGHRIMPPAPAANLNDNIYSKHKAALLNWLGGI